MATMQYLQAYIRQKDHNPDLAKDYFLKLSEEVGELGKAIRKNLHPTAENPVKNTIDEEIWDVIYYAIAIANCYDIDIENAIRLKESINNEKYHTGMRYEP